MMFEVDEYIKAIAEDLIETEPQFQKLAGCNICYMRSDKKKKKGLKTVFADCEKVSEKYKAITGYEFVITFYADAELASEEARRRLMFHELKHVGWDGEDRWIVPHDLEDFSEVIDRWGVDWISG